MIRVSSIISLSADVAQAASTDEEDVEFLKKHTAIVELSSGGSRVASAPEY